MRAFFDVVAALNLLNREGFGTETLEALLLCAVLDEELFTVEKHGDVTHGEDGVAIKPTTSTEVERLPVGAANGLVIAAEALEEGPVVEADA